MRGATMDITTIVFNKLMGGSAAILLILSCDRLATSMKRKEQVCVISEKGTKQ
jgi:hypothetical protein